MSGTLAVVSQTGETLNFYDLATGSLIAHLPSLTSEPHELCHDPKRQLLYMSHTYRHGHYWVHGDFSHEISVVDIPSKTIIDIIDTSPAKGPHGLHIDHDHDILYASVEVLPNEEGGGVIGIDLTTRRVIKTVSSKHRTHWFAMTPDGRKAYTCNKTASFISVLDFENEKMVGTIDVPDGCEEPSISPDGRYVYFPTPGFKGGSNPANPEIQVIDTTTDSVVKSIPLTKGALPVHVTPQGTILVGQYVFGEKAEGKYLHPDTASLGIIDGETHQVLGEVATGLMPLTVRCSADGKTAFAANVSSGTVSVVDLVEKRLVRSILVDDKRRGDKPVHVGAHGLAVVE